MIRIGRFMALGCLVASLSGCGATSANAAHAAAAARLELRLQPMPALAVHAAPIFESALRNALRQNAAALELSGACRADASAQVEDRGQAIFAAGGQGASASRIHATVTITLHCPDTAQRSASAAAEALAPAGTADAGRRRAAETSLTDATRFAVFALAQQQAP